MRTKNTRVIFLAILVAIFPAGAFGATITVNTAVHQTGTGVECSLYEAMQAANSNAAFGGCPAGEASPVVDVIAFNIPLAGVKTITIPSASPLPGITDPVFIDGTTQPGAACTGGLLLIEITGPASASVGIALFSGGSGSTIKGLVIRNFPSDGIRINADSNNNTVICNYLGVNAAGVAQGNVRGVQINDASNNTIGGTNLLDRNLISGNTSVGIGITRISGTATGNNILGNRIGTNFIGTAAIPNAFHGVEILAATNTSIGNAAADSGNLISGNTRTGILIGALGVNFPSDTAIRRNIIGLNISGLGALSNGEFGIVAGEAANLSLSDNVISGNVRDGIRLTASPSVTMTSNIIGLNAVPTAAIGNGSVGLLVISSSGTITDNSIGGNLTDGINISGTSNLTIRGNSIGRYGSANYPNGRNGINIVDNSIVVIGGAGVSERNVIAANAASGVFIGTSTGGWVDLSQNSIFNNTGLGIDLSGPGPTINDAGDVDTGSNDLQNFPVLLNALVGGGVTRVVGTLNSTASRQFRLEFFTSTGADITGYGEGQTYLGTATVTTNGAGNASFDQTFAVASTAGHVVTATATDLTTNMTSEFSFARALTVPTSSQVSIGGRVLASDGRGIEKAEVFIADQGGRVRRTLSNPFGYYSFDGLEAGQSYMLSASGKGFSFIQRIINAGDDITGVDIIGIAQ